MWALLVMVTVAVFMFCISALNELHLKSAVGLNVSYSEGTVGHALGLG